METDAATAATEKAMKDAGVATTESGLVDYFAFSETHTVPLPDGKQFIVHTTLNEGAKKNYQNMQSRDLIIQRTTGDAKMKMIPGDERHALLSQAITDWYLVRIVDGSPVEVPFHKRELDKFLLAAPPKIIELVEKDIRAKNPWLLAEMEIEDIDREIANLEEMKRVKIEEDQGKVSSASK